MASQQIRQLEMIAAQRHKQHQQHPNIQRHGQVEPQQLQETLRLLGFIRYIQMDDMVK